MNGLEHANDTGAERQGVFSALRLGAGALALASALLAATACREHVPSKDPPRNLLLITIDTLRADHLGCYGYERPTSPRIDELAQESVLFERAYATSSWTLPSLVSLMTSLHPSSHGCIRDNTGLDEAHDTLAELLSRQGFVTASVANHIYLARRYGLDQGIDSFDDELVLSLADRRRADETITSPQVSEKAVAWLRERPGADPERRWMLWLHYFDPHNEYLEHAGLTERFGSEDALDRYDGEIAFTDRSIGHVLDELAELGLEDDTLVVLVADHGEEFGEHGRSGHRKSLYEEVLRVPLLIRAPRIEPRRVSAPVSIVDILPTVCDLLDVPPPQRHAGIGLTQAMRGEPLQDRPLLAELSNYNGLLERNVDSWSSIVAGRWKLLVDDVDGSRSLYDLQADPDEQNDLAQARPEVVASLLEELERQVERARLGALELGGPRDVEITDSDRQRLRELGYLGSDG